MSRAPMPESTSASMVKLREIEGDEQVDQHADSDFETDDEDLQEEVRKKCSSLQFWLHHNAESA